MDQKQRNMKVLYFEESEFEFLAHGYTAIDAYDTLKQAWKEHCGLTGADFTRLSRAKVKEDAGQIILGAKPGQTYRKHKSEDAYLLHTTVENTEEYPGLNAAIERFKGDIRGEERVDLLFRIAYKLGYDQRNGTKD